MNRCDVVWGPVTPRTTTPKVSGMLEVIGPDDGFILDVCLTMSRQNCLERTHAIKDQKNGQNGRLHVFGPKEEVVIEPVQIMPRQHGCGPESTNKVYTPTKQISLCAAKSTFEKWDTSAKSIKNKNSSRIQETNLRSLNYIQETTEFYTDEQLKIDLHKLHHETMISEAKTDSIRSHWFCKPHFLAAHSSTECLFMFLKFHTLTPTKKLKDKEKNSRNVETAANNELSTEFQTNSIDDHNIDEQLSETTDDDESSSENEDRKRNAPIELLGEFLKAIMDQDYSLSKKLCQMILIYEPENTEAKQFLPLLEEKLLIESTQNFGDKEGEETDEGSSEDSEEDTSSSDSSDDDGEESSDDSDENV